MHVHERALGFADEADVRAMCVAAEIERLI